MKTDSQKQFDLHVFICTNQRENGDDCCQKGAEAIQQELKKWSKTKECSEQLKGKRIRINKAGCLDRCKDGVACVVYPQGEWILNATPDDVDAIKANIIAIARL